MEAHEYQRLAARTLIDSPGFDLRDDAIMVIWNVVGLTGEAGEIAEHVKKGIFHQHGLDREMLEKEIGDCLWYLAALCTTLGIDLSVVMEKNIDKLRLRYPNGFNSEDSKRRVDVADVGDEEEFDGDWGDWQFANQ